MKRNEYPRVLILSNTPFHLSDSNGRALGFLLKGIPNDAKIQFCIQGNCVSAELIDQCYRITDIEVAKGILKPSIQAYKMPMEASLDFCNRATSKRVKRTPLSMLLRDIAWNVCMKKTDFFDIASRFHPDYIIWQYGDSGFMANLAVSLSKKCNSKLIIFSTEDYYFKDWDYLSKKKYSLAYSIFHHEMCSFVKKAMALSHCCVCNTPQLASKFENEFGIKTEVIMQSANDIVDSQRKNVARAKDNTIIYAGNLGLNRHQSLIAIARALFKVDKSTHFEIYGRASETVVKAFENESNIIYNGFVSYETVLQRISNARLLIHAESFEPFYKKDLEAAFSTKIPDSLASGTPLLLYAPDNLAETHYLKDNNCAFVCSNYDSLESILSVALLNDEKRKEILYNSATIVDANHNLGKNQIHMQELLSIGS